MQRIIVGLVAAITVVTHGRLAHGQPDTTTAMWFGEIWEYGIVSSGTPGDTLRPMVPLFASPGESTVVDSLRAGTPVKYERLSVLRRIPPTTLTGDKAFGGEWFRVKSNEATGWLPDFDLMTLLGTERVRDPNRYFRLVHGASCVAVYSSGQSSSTAEAVLTYWKGEANQWVLKDEILNAVECGLYVAPIIDSIIERGSARTIYLS